MLKRQSAGIEEDELVDEAMIAAPSVVLRPLGNAGQGAPVGDHHDLRWIDPVSIQLDLEVVSDDHDAIRASEEIRFLLHTLPDGFHRIRHYGYLANGCRAAKLALCRRLLGRARRVRR